MEADRSKQLAYLKSIENIDKSKLVYIDESGIERNISKTLAWCKKGKIVVSKKNGKYYQRTNILAGLCNNKIIAPLVFNGPSNTELFNAWVEQFLIKELIVGQIVIMDNATFHKSLRTKELIESVGCRVIFLPPYSPELNPIEKFWANMKRWIRNHVNDFENFYQSINHFFQLC